MARSITILLLALILAPPPPYTPPDLRNIHLNEKRDELTRFLFGDRLPTEAALIETRGDRALIYHTGHLGLLDTDASAIALFEQARYAVYVVNMPPAPHDGLPIRQFVEPTIELVNALDRAGVEHIVMVGLSGGGWTTTLAAALDTRIDASYPVAGSIPLGMRWRDRDAGDEEQTYLPLYEMASYEVLYALGASDGRRQLQIRNVYDNCCFAGEDTRYLNAVQAVSSTFDVWLDYAPHEHQMSEWAIRIILGDLQLQE